MKAANAYLLSKESLALQLSETEFVLKTQRQIVKDFGTQGVDFPLEFQHSVVSVDQLLHAISQQTKTLESSNPTALSQLLYQIDVPESILADLTQTDDFHLQLSEVILRREAYKVFLRQKFSS